MTSKEELLPELTDGLNEDITGAEEAQTIVK